jgi:hypothetical protein
MDNARYYLLEEDFERAAENGISNERLRDRFYKKGWDHIRASTEPINSRKNCLWNQFKDIAVVSRNTFQRRINKGMEPLQAATKPLKEKKYTEEQLQIALSNGISEGVLKNRIYLYKMSVEEAITRPKHANRGKGLRKKNHSTAFNRYLHG